MLFIDRKKGFWLFTAGWFLQFVGHFVFEHNKPILLTEQRHPYTALSALLFVGEEWLDTLKSVAEELRERRNHKDTVTTED